eukprot:10224151-Heterocapsa_arctica.AAC.1
MQRKARAEQEGGPARPQPEAPKEVAKPPEQGEGERPLEERPPQVVCQARQGGWEAQASDAADFPPQGASAGGPEIQIK